MRRASTAAVLAGMLLASGCGGGSGNSSSGSVAGDAPSPTVAIAVQQAQQSGTPVAQQIVAADNAFGLALFNALSRGAASNIALSPTSIALALQMVYNCLIDMTLDRPFFYAIVDGKTGALLFIGTLVDPSRSASSG
jgi:serine protease inhibitor